MSLHRRILTPAPPNVSDCSGGCSAPSLPATAAASRHLSNLFIAAGCLSAAAFFLALTYYAVFNRRRRRRLAPSSPLDGFSEPAGDREHHLWHIRTVGLDEATINSIPECTVQNGVPGVVDCSVCLAEFENGELVRLLPNCAHAFHVKCIDTWFRAHITCPLCRAPVLAVAVSEAVEEEIGTSNPTLSGGEDEVDVELSNLAEPVRRSVSMPVVEMVGSFGEEEKELGCVGGESSETKGKEGSSSKESEKALSGSGRSFFFTKNGRSRSLVLPL